MQQIKQSNSNNYTMMNSEEFLGRFKTKRDLHNFCDNMNWLTQGLNDMTCFNYGQIITSKVTPTSKKTVIDDINNIKGIICYDKNFEIAMNDPKNKCRLFYNLKIRNGVK